ncbi:MAG: gliding motility-associated C-terminal domain-containing protein [Crocinitomicaceae bacterium]|nr:gliding motility-associated C-terminal domain-containing protein [Crocinitomicaceae bacterium]
MRNLILAITTLLSIGLSHAADFYWVGGNGMFNDPAHWSNQLGGSGGSGIPGENDQAFIIHTQNNPLSISFSNSVTLNKLKVFSNQPITFLGNNKELEIISEIQLNANISSGLDLVLSGTQNKINFYGSIYEGNIKIEGNVILEGNMNCGIHSLELKTGSLVSSGQSIYCKDLTVSNSFGTFNVENSVLNISGEFQLPNNANISEQNNLLNLSNQTNSVDQNFPNSVVKTTVNCGWATVSLDVTSDYNGSNVSCNGANDGQLTVTVVGGTGPFAYNLNNGGWTTQIVYNGLGAGTYQIVVLDSATFNTCIVSEIIIEPATLTPIIFNIKEATCYDSCTGEFDINLFGGTPPYTLTFPTIPRVENLAGLSTLTGFCDGTWNYSLTDINSCQFDDQVTITQPDSISATFAIAPPTCAGDCDGGVIAVASGGHPTPTYTYDWGPGAPIGDGTNSISMLCSGVYTLHVEDDSACYNDFTVIVPDPPVFQAVLAGVTDVTCNGACNGSIAANPLNGSGPYTFVWLDGSNNPIGNTDSIATGLCPGTYKVIVTDANGCIDTTASAVITEPTDITSTVTFNQPSCYGVLDGSASVVGAGGVPPYSYQWVNDGTGAQIGANQNINGLGEGDYYAIVIDSLGCPDTSAIFTLIFPDSISIVITPYDPTCYDICNGSIGAVVSGGSPAYNYNWTPGNPTGDGTDSITNLCPGNYNLQITDINGCTKSASATINAIPQYDISISSTDLTCNGSADGTIDIIVNSGGDGGPYSVTWSPVPPGGQQGNFSLTGLSSGTWDATITDGLGCDTLISITLSQPVSISVNASVNSNATCNGDCNGSATSVVAGGQGTITYSWNDISNQTTPNAIGLCAGQYILTVTDTAMCTDKDTIVITEPNSISFDTTSTAPSCWNICDGTATVSNLAGGTGALSVQWTDPLNQTSLTATGLCGGTVDVTITDQNACDTTITITIPTPSEIFAPISSNTGACFGGCTGQGFLDISGGVPGYTVNWFNAVNGVNLGVNNDTITGLCPGSYTATVTDAGGCILDADTITIIELPELFITLNSSVDATCGLCDGQADVSVSGGTGPLVVTWNPIPGSGATGTSKNDLCEGIYTITVTDSVGCSENVQVTINGIANEVITMDSTATSCYNTCDGTATANYACLVPPCTITWYDDLGNPIGQVGDVATNLCPGTYTAELENGGGCFAYETVTIDAPDTINVSVFAFSNPSCNGLCDGEIELNVTGGVPPILITWSPVPLGGQGTNHPLGLCAGWHVYTVEDANGCQYIDSLELIDNPVLDVSNFNTTDISCSGANDGQASVAPIGGVPAYSVQWFTCAGVNTGLTGQLATGLSPGSYYAEVTDASGCTQQTPCDSVRDKTPLTLVIDSNSVSCSNTCDGQLMASISGGSPNYFYQWLDQNQDTIPGETNDTLSNICSGTFYLRVSDLNSCDSTYGPFTLSAPIPWDVTITSDSATCNGIADGSGTVLVNAGNVPPYTYSWNPGGFATPIAAPIAAGTYDVTITDATGACDTVVQVVILEPDPLMFNANITPISCFGQCDGAIDLSNVSGGTPAYIYVWDGLPGGTSSSNLCPDTITIRVSDNNACFKDTTIILTEPTEIQANLVANMATCYICNGSATANPTGGAGGYSYNWTPAPGSGQGTQNVTDLCQNLYSLLVTDSQGCTDTATFAIENVNADTLIMSADSVSCFNACDGNAYASYTCSLPNCSIEWYFNDVFNNIGITDTTVQNGCAGIYYAVVTNGVGCLSIDSITVAEPTEIISNDSITPPTCYNGSDGQIIVTPSGGSGSGYTFNWTPAPGGGQGTNTATGLSPGQYIVDITDSDGCTISDTIVVPNSVEITYNLTSTNITCNGVCDGTAGVVAAGLAPLSYQWYNGGAVMVGETNPNVFGLCPGTYYVEITDDAGCTIQGTDIIITEPNALAINLDSIRNPLCNGDCNGMIEISVSGGTVPYTINWYDGSNNLIGQSDTIATGLCAGDYYAEITDINGCTITTPTYTLTEPAPFVVTLTSVANSCFGTCDGYIVASTSGGTTPYTWNFTDTLNNVLVNTIGDSTFNLCTGTYTVEVTDSNGCSFGPQQVFLQSPSEITANTFSNNATCGLTDGDATVQMLTGDAPFTYQWMDATFTPLAGETAMTISNIGAGTFYVEVTDSNGCTEQYSVNVSNPVATTLVWDTLISPTCFGDCNGAIQITATAVTMPISYLWNPGGIIDEDPTGLCAGNYSVQLTDGAGCINFYDTTLTESPEIQASFNITDPTCGLCDGDIVATVTGGATPLILSWSNGDSGANADSICAGVYDLVVTDAIGCQETFNTMVSNPNGVIAMNETITPETCFGTCDGAISINPTGTGAPYTIFWLHDGSSSSSISSLCAGDYFVQVADSSNCVETSSFTVNAPTEIVATANIIPPTCGNTDGSITLNSSGGSLPHTYLWNTTDVTQGIVNIGAGIYSVTVTDANGCTQDLSFTLSDQNGPDVSIDSSAINCFGDCNGQLNASVTGGTPAYSYVWYDDLAVAIGQTDSFAINLCEGNYTVEVTDALGCIGYASSIVEDVDTLILSLPVVSDISCFGACDGQINYIVSGGTQPYTYSWNDPGNSSTLGADSLCAGTFTVLITDANGCMLTDSATVVEPTEIIITTDSITDATCINSPDGAIYSSVSGGTPGYSYSWTSQDGLFTDTNLIVTGLFPMDYYLQVTDASGCIVYDTVSVDTSLILIANAGNDTIICDQSQIQITGIVTASGATTVEWTDSLGNVLSDSLTMIDFPGVGVNMYIFNVSQGVCTTSDTVYVTVAAPFTVDAGADVQILYGQSTQIGGAPTGPDSTTFAWSPTIFLDDSTVSNPNVIEPQLTTQYFVYVTDTNGCVFSDSVTVIVVPDLVIINGFTPNGDGVNDVWELDFAVYFPDIEVFVYNRWGEELFRSSGYAVPWDGMYKGKLLPVGTYYYIIQVNDNKYPEPFAGPVTIMR